MGYVKNKIILFFLCVTFIIFVIFPGCGKKDGKKKDQSSPHRLLLDIILEPQNGQEIWVKDLERLTGRDWEIVQPLHNQYSRKMKIAFFSSYAPELCEIPRSDYSLLGNSSFFVPLNDFIKKSENIRSIDKKYYEPYRRRDGNIYAFPLSRGGGCVAYIRGDWLDNLELDPPEDWEEFYALLRAFTYGDPDGNGVNDTFGYSTVVNEEFDYYNRFFMLQGRFDFYQKEGRWVDGFLEPETREALERFKSCYDQGLVDPELFTNETTTMRTKFYEGRVGIIEYWSGQWALRLEESVKSSGNPGSRVIPLAPIRGAYYLERNSPALGILKNASYPEELFFAFIDLMHDKGPGQMLFTYGVEGVHYRREKEGYVMLKEQINPDRSFIKAYVHPELTLNDWKLPLPLEPAVLESRRIHMAFSRPMDIPEGGELYVQYVSDVMNLKKEIFAGILMGIYSIEEGLEQYRSRATGFHLEGILKELNFEG